MHPHLLYVLHFYITVHMYKQFKLQYEHLNESKFMFLCPTWEGKALTQQVWVSQQLLQTQVIEWDISLIPSILTGYPCINIDSCLLGTSLMASREFVNAATETENTLRHTHEHFCIYTVLVRSSVIIPDAGNDNPSWQNSEWSSFGFLRFLVVLTWLENDLQPVVTEHEASLIKVMSLQ